MTVTIISLSPMTGVGGLNNAGEVAGWETIAKTATVLTPVDTTTITNGLTWLNGVSSVYASPDTAHVPVIFLQSVNDLGVLGGSENENTVGQLPTLWQNGATTALALPGSDTNGLVVSLNDFGTAVGVSYGFDSNYDFTTRHAVLWKNGIATLLSPLIGDGGDTTAEAVNANGEVVGFSGTTTILADGDSVSHAVMWASGGTTAVALATLPGAISSYAYAINTNGQIVGDARYADSSHLVLWQNGAATDLGTLSGFSWLTAFGINDLGQVVGQVATGDPDSTSPGTQHAFLWQNGTFEDLNNLLPANSGWVLQVAYAINDSGQIIGDGTLNGTSATFFLSLNGGATASSAQGVIQAFQQGLLSSPVSLPDMAADIAANIDGLQAVAAAGKLGSLLLIDSGVPTLSITDTQLVYDAGAWLHISGNYLLSAPSASVLHLDADASAYTITANTDGSVTVIGAGVSETVPHAAALQFADYTEFVTQTPGTNTVTTGNIAELYAAVLGREPDVAGLIYYQDALTANPAIPLTTFAQSFLASPEYTGNSAHAYAATAAGDAQFITDTYNNLLHRAPETGAVAWYQTNVLDPILGSAAPGSAAYAAAQILAHAQLLVDFSASAEFLADVQITAQHPADAQHWLLLT